MLGPEKLGAIMDIDSAMYAHKTFGTNFVCCDGAYFQIEHEDNYGNDSKEGEENE